VADVNLHAGVVLGLDELVGPGAAEGVARERGEQDYTFEIRITYSETVWPCARKAVTNQPIVLSCMQPPACSYSARIHPLLRMQPLAAPDEHELLLQLHDADQHAQETTIIGYMFICLRETPDSSTYHFLCGTKIKGGGKFAGGKGRR